MNSLIFLCVGGDSRQTYMCRKLAAFGKVCAYGIDCASENVIRLSSLEQMTEKADVLVLPMMQGDGLEIRCAGGAKTFCTEVSKYLKKKCLVTGGRLSTRQIEYFSALGFDVTDYFNREELVIRNCIPTAEGALQIAMKELGTTVFGSRVLITGYGRVAKACANLFKACGAEVTVCARRLSPLAEASNNNLNTFGLTELYGHVPRFDVIINTVPAMIFDKQMLEAVPKKALIIDLASKPGGLDYEAAAALNRRAVQALSLPGKSAPITAGEIIADTVRNILLERGK